MPSEYALRGIDRRAGPHTDLVLDMNDLDHATAAFEGAEAVVDLAANPEPDAPWETVYANNLPATINAFEAARRAGVRRVIFASSNHVVGSTEREEPYASILAGHYEGMDPDALRRVSTTDPVRPDGPYGIGKVLGEAAGRYYSDHHRLSVICLRIGSVVAEDEPVTARHFATLLTKRDLLGLVRCCLAAPDALRFGIYFGVSANRWRIWDIETASRELGYEPRDDAERWR